MARSQLCRYIMRTSSYNYVGVSFLFTGPCFYLRRSDSIRGCVRPSVGRLVRGWVGDAFAFRPSRSDLWPCIRPCSFSPLPFSAAPTRTSSATFLIILHHHPEFFQHGDSRLSRLSISCPGNQVTEGKGRLIRKKISEEQNYFWIIRYLMKKNN